MQNEYNNLCTGGWAEPNPNRCPCKGYGWLLSDLDTWHRCPIHGKGVPHPEDEGTPYDGALHLLTVQRAAYRDFRDAAIEQGFTGDFKEACAKSLATTPAEWVNAAESLCLNLLLKLDEEAARDMGYSCALERRFEDEAAMERAEHRRQ